MSFRIARIAGIEVGANWTWLIVVALILWSLARSVFPDQNPGLARSTYWAMAAVAAVCFFVSILLHELGHALVARHEGVQIERGSRSGSSVASRSCAGGCPQPAPSSRLRSAGRSSRSRSRHCCS
jgi:hypothetical protein